MSGFGSRLPVLLWLALMIAGAWVLLAHTRLVSDLTLFLPRGSTPVEELLVDQLRSGPAIRAVLIALEGAPGPILAQTSKTLAKRLRGGNEFSLVNNGETPLSPKERELLLNHRYLLSPGITPARFTATALRKSLEERLQSLASPIGVTDQQLLPRDPTGEIQRLLRIWAGRQETATRHGVWFTSDGTRALLLVETRAPPLDSDAQEKAINRLRSEFAIAAEIDSIRLLLSGPAVIALEARNSIRLEARLLSGLAIGIVVFFLFAVYRSLRLIVLFGIPVMSGLVAGGVAVSLTFGGIHAITLAFGATIIGVALDYPIHLFSNRAADEPPSRVIARIWPTLRLGVASTALGFSAMLFSGFDGLSQLGLFAIVGLVTAAAVTRWVLPLLDSARTATHAENLMLHVSTVVARLRNLRWALFVITIAGLIYLLSLDHSPWEADIANLSPLSSEQKQVDQQLRTAIGAPDVQKIIVGFGETPEEALTQSEALAAALDPLVAQGALAGYDAPSLYLPSTTVQRQRLEALPEQSALRKMLKSANRDLPFREDLFEPFVADVVAAREKWPLELADFEDTSLGLKLKSLLFPRGHHWVALLPLRGATDDALILSRVAKLDMPSVHFLDLKESSNRLVTRYRNEALALLALGSAGIILLLAVCLRSAETLARVLLPVGASVITVATLLVVFNERISLFHIVALLLVAGVGLDYGLFFNRRHHQLSEGERTARAVLTCNVTTVIVFGVLALSKTPVLHAIGLTTALGAVLCMLFAAALSPEYYKDTAYDPSR